MTASANYLHGLFGLDGLTAVVIGGTGVLGGAFCDALGGAGAHVVVVGRTLKTDAETGKTVVDRIVDAGGLAEFFKADSTSREDVEAIVAHLKASGRETNVLINGAGTNSATPFLEITDDEWDNILNTNLRAVRLACQIFGKDMVERGTKGSIINIASLSGVIPLSRVFTYSASKGAVLNLTKNLAREFAQHGIRVNALSPGFFPAEQNRKVLTPDRVESIRNHTPTIRETPGDPRSPFGTPDELAGAILLMAAPKAGSFLTGENIVVDGGFLSMTI
ncbi:MAG: SDR family NAD(P)-dependent oxidoreductase [Planctomycetota bacterium]|nr:SDR family NAD(P)-dependent oxidoreductase [Planctomycetota bacterium]MDA1163244.1 SDR family NAD(P)-dependent oxidoreductase [Planctomycetota bacterium]